MITNKINIKSLTLRLFRNTQVNEPGNYTLIIVEKDVFYVCIQLDGKTIEDFLVC